MVTAIIQDVLRSITDYLAGERVWASVISRIDHVAGTDAELILIDVSCSSVDIGQGCVTVGKAGAIGGTLAARARDRGKQKNFTTLRIERVFLARTCLNKQLRLRS